MAFFILGCLETLTMYMSISDVYFLINFYDENGAENTGFPTRSGKLFARKI